MIKATSTLEHEGELLTKIGSAWTNDEGRRFPPETLHRYECSCGWKGLGWYRDESRARGHLDRHLGSAR